MTIYAHPNTSKISLKDHIRKLLVIKNELFYT
ncbi:hypothetical protein SAMN05421786_10244 [Chryseobacterium ureilyticum]|uniref:Uncharacterized protein n=1 Tax=Chryseobacterium ureilyticum TaxID=373668 RepID=A0A1N7LWJ6_9FLAO|nr:hypothetical protein SAMN05421786_10244 [Chryseobacterium ureilyticum]